MATTPAIDFAERRGAMVDYLARRGIRDPRVLAAMRTVPRERFVPEHARPHAYQDVPLAIGGGQTISQPYVVAIMASEAELAPGIRLLDIGTGSGYAAAIAAEIGCVVHGIEVRRELAEAAQRRLDELGYAVQVHHGDGARGLPEQAPFDVIMAAAAARKLPRAWLEQLAPGGRVIAPLGPRKGDQRLVCVTGSPDAPQTRLITVVRFVPLV